MNTEMLIAVIGFIFIVLAGIGAATFAVMKGSDEAMWITVGIVPWAGIALALITGFVGFAPVVADDEAQSVPEAPQSVATDIIDAKAAADNMTPVNVSTLSGRIVPCMTEVDAFTAKVKANAPIRCAWAQSIQLGQSVEAPMMVALTLQNSGILAFPLDDSKDANNPHVFDCVSTNLDIINQVKAGKFDPKDESVSCYEGEPITRTANPDRVTTDDIEVIPGIVKLYPEKAADVVPAPTTGDTAQSDTAAPGADNTQSATTPTE